MEIIDMEYLGYINTLTTIIIINDYIIKNNARKNFPIIKKRFFNNTNLESTLENSKIENFNRVFLNNSNFGRSKYNKNNIYINYNKRENYKSYK